MSTCRATSDGLKAHIRRIGQIWSPLGQGSELSQLGEEPSGAGTRDSAQVCQRLGVAGSRAQSADAQRAHPADSLPDARRGATALVRAPRASRGHGGVLAGDGLTGLQRYVFSFRGRPIIQLNTKAWYAALERAGITDFRWHDLRHTWASWHVQNGTPLFALQELAGWESAEMVRRYAHLAADHLAPYADRLCVSVGGHHKACAMTGKCDPAVENCC